ncbi:hypothetical protein [Bacillus cereus]|uniref:Asparagine synthetase domain-containing protein n=1 Tax=Bacillus cereus TaxID=1396 RepID=A0AA44TCQ6_BACCE|nr:hypothetical protein [Bacillus cereus]PFN07076.1 hypothetical protein COJ55_12070 [Bacillus cereus]PFR89955.1 hypothetical protein COK38_23805 [Bacillus cereus]
MAILGNVIDLNVFSSNKKDIAKNLIAYFRESTDKFFDYLDELAGRYFIFYGDNSQANILSDATGMRSIFYSTDKTVISSHCELVQEVVQAAEVKLVKKEWLRDYSSYHLPGHYTLYENIYFLTPNTLLNITEKKVKRFFPREHIVTRTVADVVEEITCLIKGQMKQIVQLDKKLLFSLTAGIDSRTSLSFLREYKEHFEYFTYSKKNAIPTTSVQKLDLDRELVGEIVENLGLNHRFITMDYGDNSEELKRFSNVLKRNTFTYHNLRLAKLYLDNFSNNHLHIRSNLLEIGRSFYKKQFNFKLPKSLTVESMVKCYSYKAMNDKRVFQAFENFYSQVSMDSIFNYDPYDILYWEYRMGTWHSQVLLESDVAHDTYILFNARRILKLLLSVPPMERNEHIVFKQLITQNWPVLNYWKINALETLMDYYDEQFDDFGLKLNDAKYVSGSINDQHREVAFQAVNQPRRVKFFMERSNPKAGDYVAAELTIHTKLDEYYTCIVQVRSPYENKNYRGRLQYQVLLNGQLLLEEDICDWKESNQISINWNSRIEENTISIRVLAKKDCETWSWGRAATILIERMTLRRGEHKEKLAISASSPYSKTFNYMEK